MVQRFARSNLCDLDAYIFNFSICTRASLKQAPPPRSVNESGTSAFDVKPIGDAAPPDAFRHRHGASSHKRCDPHRQPHLSLSVEHPHDLAVLKIARRRVCRDAPRTHHRGSRQLSERRADRPLAGRRDERQRDIRPWPGPAGNHTVHEARRRRAPPETGAPCRRWSAASRRRTALAGRRTARVAVAPVRSSSPCGCGQAIEQIEHGFELAGGIAFAIESERGGSAPRRPRGSIATRRPARSPVWQLQRDRPVGLHEIVVLEKRRRRQDDVGVERGVGQHLIEDDREQVFPLEPFEHA